jgi:hypothetical protein
MSQCTQDGKHNHFPCEVRVRVRVRVRELMRVRLADFGWQTLWLADFVVGRLGCWQT